MRITQPALVVVTLLTFTALSGADKSSGSERTRSSRERADLHFKQSNPEARFFEINGFRKRIYGPAFSHGLTADDSARKFVQRHSGVLGVPAQDLDTRGPLANGQHTQQVSYNSKTGQYKFTLVYYTQRRDAIPVFRSDLRLLVRNEPGYPLVLAASSLRDLGDFDPENLPVAAAPQGVIEGGAHDAIAGLQRFSPFKPVIWAGINDEVAEPKLAVEFIAYESFQNWLVVSDALTGEVLYKEPRLLNIDVTGNVRGMATTGSGSEQCEPEFFQALPYVEVRIPGGGSAFADGAGNFTIPNGGSAAVTVESGLDGQWFDVINWPAAEPNTVLQSVVTPPGPADFDHNSTNSPLLRSEVNGYLNSNDVRDLVVQHNPSYPEVGFVLDFPVYVNRTDGFCPGNAWYDPGLRSINFCQEGGGFPNTAWTSVVYHEYGHHLVAAAGSGQDQYGEGMGDVMSVLMLDEHEVGIGFFGSCVPADSLRDAENTIQYPCTGSGHTCGQLIAGCVWDTRNALTATEPLNYLSVLSNMAINSMLVHTGSTIDPSITIDYITLDDDDGNINNGSPHHAEICTGFGAHNMDCPVLDLLGFSYPSGLPTTVVPDTATTISVDVVGVSGTPAPGTGTVSFRIDGGGFTTVPMTELSPNEYEATLPGTPCGSIIEFYFSATATVGGTFSDPANAPLSSFSAISVVELLEIANFDFETNPGWTVANQGGLSDGAWNRGVPIGGGDRGDPPSDYDGSGACWLTDNVDGNSDVDDGTTILTSNVFDLSGTTDPQLTYARWYDNTAGDAPQADVFVVEISANGTTWVEVETVGPTGTEVQGGWFERTWRISDYITPSSTTQVRFSASDLSAGSIVEAAVDAFSLLDATCVPCEEPCDDGNACTINDTCVGVICQGTAVDCSGFGDQCNAASCNPAGAEGNCDLLNPVANGTTCDDSNACNINEICIAGACAGGTAPNCSGAGDDCNAASCDAGGADGNCDIIAPVTNGTDCDDSDACNVGEACQSGACVGGSAPDCSASDTECSLGSCSAMGPDGNCDADTPILDGTSCDGGLGICQSGACVPDPGDNTTFMVASAASAPASPGGPTIIHMSPGQTATIEVWAADLDPQNLNSYQIGLPSQATPLGATGSVSYVDTAGPGGSVVIDATHPNFAFAGQSSELFYSETGLPAGFAMIATLPFGASAPVIGSAYLGEFEVTASADACGSFSLSFLPDGAPPNGGTALVDEDTAGIAAVFQSIVIEVGPANDECDDATAVTGNLLSVDFDTSCGDQDGPTHTCGDADHDIWYAYTATCNGQLIASTTTNCSIDTTVIIYDAGATCPTSDSDLLSCADTPADCESTSVAAAVGETYLVRVGSVAGEEGPGTLTLTCEAPCSTASDCGDIDMNNVTDDHCMFYECAGGCSATPRTFADAGGSFGSCPIDGFANIHDRNHVLLCFGGINTCDPINHDLGGSFGACLPDGFCNIHDANHVDTTFAGTNPCSCPTGPAPEFGPAVVGEVALTLDAATVASAGDVVDVHVHLDGAIAALQGFQLNAVTTGGKSGDLQLEEVIIEPRKAHVFSGLDAFSASNIGNGQVLGGLPGDVTKAADGAYLATFRYRIPLEASGQFVIDVSSDQTYLIADGNGMIELKGTTPAVIDVRGSRFSAPRR
jgi:hypothetical protein